MLSAAVSKAPGWAGRGGAAGDRVHGLAGALRLESMRQQRLAESLMAPRPPVDENPDGRGLCSHQRD